MNWPFCLQLGSWAPRPMADAPGPAAGGLNAAERDGLPAGWASALDANTGAACARETADSPPCVCVRESGVCTD